MTAGRSYSGSPHQQQFTSPSISGSPQLPPPSFASVGNSQLVAPPVAANNGNHAADLPPLKPVFGISLDNLFQRDGSAVPIVVYQCLQAVDLFGLEVEGIYRLSGTASHVTKLRAIFDNGESCLGILGAPMWNTEATQTPPRWISGIPRISSTM